MKQQNTSSGIISSIVLKRKIQAEFEIAIKQSSDGTINLTKWAYDPASEWPSTYCDPEVEACWRLFYKLQRRLYEAPKD